MTTSSRDMARRQIIGSDALGQAVGSRLDLPVKGCVIERLPRFADYRGSLIPLEAGRGSPFAPTRIVLVYGVPGDHVRGEHAHDECEQFLIAAHGSLSASVDDGQTRADVRLEDSTVGLYLAPMVWGTQYDCSPDSVLLVAASHRYDVDDYMRDYDLFKSEVARR